MEKHATVVELVNPLVKPIFSVVVMMAGVVRNVKQ